jgi:hypothetical protein
MIYVGTVRNGKVELPEDLDLPEGTQVRVEPIANTDDPAIGLADEAVQTGIRDLASQHDHYIYGSPKH